MNNFFWGADVRRTTSSGDTALYLATYGILNSNRPDPDIIADLIKAGEHQNCQYADLQQPHKDNTLAILWY